MIEQISVFPPFDEKERKLNPSYRFHCIQRLFQYFQPFEKHLDLEQRISRAIRQGYLHRNPMKKEEIMRVHESYKAIKEGKFIKIIKQKPNGQQQGSPLSVYLVLENRPQSRGSCPLSANHQASRIPRKTISVYTDMLAQARLSVRWFAKRLMYELFQNWIGYWVPII